MFFQLAPSILFALSHLVVEVDEQCGGGDPDDDESGPVVVVDGVDRVLAEPGHSGVKNIIGRNASKKYPEKKETLLKICRFSLVFFLHKK